MLGFSTFARNGSLVRRGKALDEIEPAAVVTVASIHLPETPEVFSTSIDAFIFDDAIEAQPCADYALTRRGYEPVLESGQRGLFIGGSVGIFYENGEKLRGARSHAVVRGRTVLVVVMEFPITGSDAFLEETGVFVANLAFDMPEATRFLPKDIVRLALPLPGRPFPLAYPSSLKVTLNLFPAKKPSGMVIFSLGDPDASHGWLTFGFSQDASGVDAATLDGWAARIAEEYAIQNPSVLSKPKLVTQGKIGQLKGTSMSAAYYLFHLDDLELQRQNQIRVVVVADGIDRYSFSMRTITKIEKFFHFLVFAAGTTSLEVMVDSLLHRLTGRGM